MSLNNRIYFRDQLSIEHGSIANILAPNGARATTPTPLRFAIPGPQPRALNTDIFPHLDITWQADQVGSRGDDTSADSPLVRAIFRRNRYPVLAFLSSPLSSHVLGNAICFPEIPKGRGGQSTGLNCGVIDAPGSDPRIPGGLF